MKLRVYRSGAWCLGLALFAGCQGRGARSDWAAQFAAVGAGDAIVFREEGEPLDEPAAIGADLTIERATREALRTNPEIQAALAKVRAAEAESDQARLLPNPVVTLVVRARSEGSGIITPSIAEDLIVVLRRPAAMRAADKRLRAATAEAVAAVLTAMADVQQTYIAIRAIDDEMLVLDDRMKLIQRLAGVAKNRLDAGEGTRLDVLTLEAQRLTLEATVAEKALQRSQERLTLARQLGRPSAEADWRLAAWGPPASLSLGEGAYVRSALAARPEVQARLWELSALGDEATLSRWAVWEGLGVGAEAERDVTWSAGPAVTVPLPLFDTGGPRRDKAVAELIGARHELARAQREVIESVRKAYATYVQAQKQVAQVRDQLTPVQEQRRAQAEAAYRAGLTDLTTLIVAEQDLQETREKLIELREKAAVAYVTLQKATAGQGGIATKNEK